MHNSGQGRGQGAGGLSAVCSPGRWRSGGSATWTHMTSCWRGTRRWTWSMGCCSTSCNRVTGQRCRAPERRRGPQAAVERGLPGRPLCSELCSSCACRVLQRTFQAASGREPLAHTPPSSSPRLLGFVFSSGSREPCQEGGQRKLFQANCGPTQC